MSRSPDSAHPMQNRAPGAESPRAGPSPSGLSIGRHAESLAAAFLELRGYRILERNVRDGPRELDLVAEEAGWVVVVEVRFRQGTARGLPEETVGFHKRTNLLRAGRARWLERWRGLGRLRFDLISLHFTLDGLCLRHHRHFMNPDRR